MVSSALGVSPKAEATEAQQEQSAELEGLEDELERRKKALPGFRGAFCCSLLALLSVAVVSP